MPAEHIIPLPYDDKPNEWCMVVCSRDDWWYQDGHGFRTMEEPADPYWVFRRDRGDIWEPSQSHSRMHVKTPSPPVNVEPLGEARTDKRHPDYDEEYDPQSDKYKGYKGKEMGSWDSKADYVKYSFGPPSKQAVAQTEPSSAGPAEAPFDPYQVLGAFNRKNGNFQAPEIGPERHSDQAKSGRQLNAHFDLEKAAQDHNGQSLKAELREKKLSRKEVQQFRKRKIEKKKAKLRSFYQS